MTLCRERRSMEFRKDTFEIVFHYYQCEESGEQFTSTSLDEVNMNQVYNQYRDKFNIPFPDEITRIREKYDLSGTKMSEIMGFGVNTYRLYEAGEMPSVSNGKMIQMIDDPKNFIEMVELCSTLDEKSKVKYIQRAQSLIDEKQRNIFNLNFKDFLLGSHLADIYSGYRNPNFEKFTEMIVYFSEQLAPYKTKMNKLLFYSDFLMFKQSCFSISGMRYKALEMGPVPNNFQSIFEYLSNNEVIEICTTEFPGGYTGEQFKARSERPVNTALFSEEELKVLETIVKVFKTSDTCDIIEISHQEEAWLKNFKDKSIISYEYGFELRGV